MSIAEKLVTVAENTQNVYKAGQKAEYDKFWDAYQNNGNRIDYQRCFSGLGWTAETLRPKYDIKPKYGGGAAIFQGCGFSGSLKKHFEELGVHLNFSELVTLAQAFYQASNITELPDIDISNCTNGCTYLFYQCTSLKNVKIKISENVVINTNSFTDCSALEELRFSGVVGKSLDLHWSTKLSAESYESIFDCLSRSVSGQTLTLPANAQDTYDATFGAGSFAQQLNNIANWQVVYS